MEYFVFCGTYTGFTYMRNVLPAGESHSKGIYFSRAHGRTEQTGTGGGLNPASLRSIPTSGFFMWPPKIRNPWGLF